MWGKVMGTRTSPTSHTPRRQRHRRGARQAQTADKGSLAKAYFQAFAQQIDGIPQVLKTIIGRLDRHAVGVTLLVSAFLAVSTFIMRFFSYCHDLGIVQYWSLDTSCIQLSNDNFIYYVLFSAAICALVLLGSLALVMLYSIEPNDISTLRLIFYRIIFTIFLCLVLSLAYVFLFFSSWSIEAQLYSLCLSLVNVFLAIGFLAITYSLKGSSGSIFTRYPMQSAIALAFLLIVSGCLSAYHLGSNSADSQRTFPLLNDTQVVVYSTSTTYYTARYTIDGDTILIDTSHRGTYARADGELEYRTFANVILQD